MTKSKASLAKPAKGAKKSFNFFFIKKALASLCDLCAFARKLLMSLVLHAVDLNVR
jgi:hypothetical protein